MGSLASNASHTVDQVKDTASSARANLVDLGVHAMKLLDSVRSQEVRAVDSVLGRIGLQRRDSAVRPVWFFAAGALVAASVALILAPTSGKKLRAKIRNLVGMAEAKGVERRVEVVPASNTSDAAKPSNGADQPRVAENPS